MTLKIVLGQRPGNFTVAVKFKSITGQELQITCTYKYRTVPEFGELVDRHQVASAAASLQALQQTYAASYAGRVEGSARYLADVLEAWDLDVPLNHSNLVELCATLPGAVAAIVKSYAEAIEEGRSGN